MTKIKVSRICAIGLVNTIVIVWILKVVFFDKDSDFIGLLVIGTVVFLLLFNIYAIILYEVFSKKTDNFLLEAVFFFVLILPLVAIWYFTRK